MHTESVIDQYISRLRLLPEAQRDFSADLRQARLEFGVNETLAQELVAHGLPHTTIDGSPRFCVTDLHYVGLRLGCATTYIGVLRRWASGLCDTVDWSRATVEITPLVPPGTGIEAIIGPAEHFRGTVGDGRITVTHHPVANLSSTSFGSELADILIDIGSLDYCWIPEPLRADLDIVRSTGLSDCATAAHLLGRECDRLGIPARAAYGLLLAVPFATPHNWIEVLDDDRWIPLSPLLLGLLTRFGGLDYLQWPPTRSPGDILLRLAEQETPIVTAAGTPVEASFVTKFTDA